MQNNKHDVDSVISNIAIQGGGVRGIAYVGSFIELEKHNLLDNVKRVAGTSAGALVALIHALGYSADEMHKIMAGLNFNKFSSGKQFLRLFTRYGIHSGDYIIQFVTELLQNSKHKLDPSATFADMKNCNCPDLHVFATDLSLHTHAEFSAKTTPDVRVAEAVRASMSIPFYFKAWRFRDNKPNNHIYVDGGLIYNYPISFFDSEPYIKEDVKGHDPDDVKDLEWFNYNPATLGLSLFNSEDHDCDQLPFYRLVHYTKHLFETLINSQSIVLDLNKSDMTRTISIDCFDITATDFSLTKEKQNRLVESGRKHTQEWIKSKYPELQTVF